jgi:hypothetical protein
MENVVTAAPTEILQEWRSPMRRRIVGTALAGAVAATLIAWTVGSVVAALVGDGPALALFVVACAPLSWLAVYVTIGLWNARLVITRDEVIIANALQTYRVQLADADRFEALGDRTQPHIVLRRRNGTAVGVLVFFRDGFLWNLKKVVAGLEPEAERLNAVLDAARAR